MKENQKFINRFNAKDKIMLEKFFNKLNDKLKLNKKDKRKVINDFEKFIMYYYHKKGMNSILKMLDLDIIYNSQEWYSLDTSSKIYPLSMQEEWMSIYRLSYYLNENINHVVLQIALFFTLYRFPIFKTSIHSGFYWNYLDSVNKHYKVEEEKHIPCSKMNLSKMKNSLFRVLYYQKRISCEFFHVLSDANGGIVFLTTLTNEYLRLMGKKVSYNKYALKINEPMSYEEKEDMFLKSEVRKGKSSLTSSKALQLDGRMSLVSPSQIIHFDLDYQKVHELAKKNNLTINELLLSYLFLILSYSTSKNGFIKIQVPVNMRKYYQTKTLRNFSLYTIISIEKRKITSLEEVMQEVKKQSNEKITEDKMNDLLYHSYKLVRNVRFVPLIIKKPIARFIYKFFGDKGSTTILSNLGKVDLPKEMLNNVIKGDFVLGTTFSNRCLFSVMTVGNILTLTLSKFTLNKAVENNLYSLLKENDLIIKVHGSGEYETKN